MAKFRVGDIIDPHGTGWLFRVESIDDFYYRGYTIFSDGEEVQSLWTINFVDTEREWSLKSRKINKVKYKGEDYV